MYHRLIAVVLFVTVHSNTTLSSQQEVWNRFGSTSLGSYGHSLTVFRDVDGDGTADVLVGAPDHLVRGTPGQVQVLSGRDGSVLATRSGTAAGDAFGFSLAVLGDADGDGVADVAVGAPLAAAAAAEVQVLSGTTFTTLYIHPERGRGRRALRLVPRRGPRPRRRR
jgi:hypothetical protein